MTILRILLLILCLDTWHFNIQAQDFPMWVLKKGIVGKPFILNKTKGNDYDELKITYLGTLKSNENKAYKIMSSCWIWGIAKRATSRVLVYTVQNKYLGNYPLTVVDELPIEIKNNKLVFQIADYKTHKLISYKISFDSKPPEYMQLDDLFHFDNDYYPF
jgi:hypothetical protein